MVYIEERKKNGKSYYYAKESYRKGGKVLTRTISYLGTDKKLAQQKLTAINNPPLLKSKEQEQIKIITNKYCKFQKSLDPATKAQIKKDFVILFVNETNKIEGSTFTLKESKLLLEDNITPKDKNLREVYEQINIKSLFDIHKENPFKITEKDIIKVHEIFVKNIDKRTGFRTRPVRILGSQTKTSPPEHIKTDIKIMLKWYEKEKKRIHPLTLAAIFHAKFEQIHPFADGNGRVGRFLVYVMLEKTMPILFPNRKKYLDALEMSQNKELDSTKRKDFDKIISYFLLAQKHTWKKFFSVR